jgi:hypothetical protein
VLCDGSCDATTPPDPANCGYRISKTGVLNGNTITYNLTLTVPGFYTGSLDIIDTVTHNAAEIVSFDYSGIQGQFDTFTILP